MRVFTGCEESLSRKGEGPLDLGTQSKVESAMLSRRVFGDMRERMQEYCCTHGERIIQEARRELAAYLAAMQKVGGCEDLITLGDGWIEMMKYLEWPEKNYEGFFRCVSLYSVVRLVHAGFVPHESTIQMTAKGDC